MPSRVNTSYEVYLPSQNKQGSKPCYQSYAYYTNDDNLHAWIRFLTIKVGLCVKKIFLVQRAGPRLSIQD